MANNLVFKRQGLPPKRPTLPSGGRVGSPTPPPAPDEPKGETRKSRVGPAPEGKSPEQAATKFDRNVYHREYMKAYMRKRRAKLKGKTDG